MNFLLFYSVTYYLDDCFDWLRREFSFVALESWVEGLYLHLPPEYGHLSMGEGSRLFWLLGRHSWSLTQEERGANQMQNEDDKHTLNLGGVFTS